MQKVVNWLKSWRSTLDFSENSWGLALRAAGVVGTCFILDWFLMSFTKIPVDGYYKETMVSGLLWQSMSLKYALSLLPVLIFVLIWGRRLTVPWSYFQKGSWFRMLVFSATVILTWVYATYDYNLYFDQTHTVDRLLLISLCLLVWWRPLFIFPYLTLLFTIIYQFTIIPGYSWAAPLPLIRIIELFGAFLIVSAVTKKAHISDLVVIICSVFISHYWVPGTGKLSSWWLLHDQVQYLLPGTYANGWLSFLRPENISEITVTIARFNLPIKIVTLLVECGVLLFFWHRRNSLVLLAGFICLHMGIFLISGINFWMWIAINVVLIVLFIKKEAFGSLPLYSSEYKLLSAVVILTSPVLFRPVQLAWLDVPITYTYKFEATTTNNQQYLLPPSFFAPYQYQFTLGTFRYMVDSPSLPVVWGVTKSKELATWLHQNPSPDQVLSYEKSNGKVYYNADDAKHLDLFLKTTIANWNQRPGKRLFTSGFKPPRLLWTYPKSPGFKTNAPIKQIRIVQVTSYFYLGKYLEIRRKPIHEVVVPDS